MRVQTKAENWVDEYVTFEKVTETEFIYNGETYKLHKPNQNDPYVQTLIVQDNSGEGLFTMFKFEGEKDWVLITCADTERRNPDPMKTAVKNLAFIGA